MVECNEQSIEELQTEVLDFAHIDSKMVRRYAKKFLKKHFFPPELRASLWVSLIKNPTRLNIKWYKGYRDVIKARDSYGSADLISKKIVEAMKSQKMEEDPDFNQSCLRMLLIFELNQPDVGYVPDMETVVMFLRKLAPEDQAFIIFFNLIFSYTLIWSIYNQNPLQVILHLLNLLDYDLPRYFREYVPTYPREKSMFFSEQRSLTKVFYRGISNFFYRQF